MTNYHKHESLELVYIASGAIQMTYFKSANDIQPKIITVHENQFMIIRPGVKHAVIVSLDESNLDLYNIIEPQGQIKND